MSYPLPSNNENENCCKSCNNFDSITNICILDNKKCYPNRTWCSRFKDGEWGTNSR